MKLAQNLFMIVFSEKVIEYYIFKKFASPVFCFVLRWGVVGSFVSQNAMSMPASWQSVLSKTSKAKNYRSNTCLS